MEESKLQGTIIGTICCMAAFLTCAFITLKLAGIIDWPWIWVVSPAWVTFWILVLSFILLMGYLVIFALSQGDGKD
jgi:hypothetical protein